jgi:protein-S-isoprenylcysteine O-methyltransferase Ste14
MTVLRRIARLRVPIGFLSGVLVLWLAHPTARTLTLGAIIAAAGEALRVWAAGHLEKGSEVTASGPYALTRHPLYVGSIIIGLGLAVASASIVVAVLVLAYLAITLTAAIRTEEAHLTEKFGAAYPEYRAGRTATVSRAFSLARAMRNREYRAIVGLVIAIGVLALKMSFEPVYRGFGPG